MRLSTIKLSGFKSFVDPTVLHLPSNMTGVVGPNGCGKSNIIDAVRWVMGESSASRLRGDNLTDVIFAGSSARKPVSQATVELIFDNSDSLIFGEYANFSEISVRRTVSRDGQSIYYLNGTRCRRRDITDLFLGTGLGPRSYSIIEQGMISQVIEAKPEELRVYLEEAAGISKYKERRRETEQRMRHTRENLERLTDVRDEVGKQLDHLKRQAHAAKQYQALKVEQGRQQAQLQAIDLRRNQAELAALRERIAGDETGLEALLAQQRQAEAQIELCRVQQGEAQAHLGTVQAESYRIGSEIARIEQQISHARELHQRLLKARGETEQALAELRSHIGNDESQLQTLQARVAELQPQLQAAQASDAQAQQALHDAESALVDWQQRWDAWAKAQAEASRATEVERTRIEYLDQQGIEAGRRYAALSEERAGLDLAALSAALAEMQARQQEQRAALDAHTAELERRKQAQMVLLERQRQVHAELSEVRKRQQEARGRLASLEALQHAALGLEENAALDWLRARGIADDRRLGEVVQVEAGWEAAVETVLGNLLEAVVVEQLDTGMDALSELSGGRVALLVQGGDAGVIAADSLAAKVRGPAALRQLLAPVRAVETLADARTAQADLAIGQSVVTRAGEWLGRGWLRVLRSGEAQQGTIAREREIQGLRADSVELTRTEAAHNQELLQLESQWTEAERAYEDAQRNVYLAQRAVSELSGQIQSQQGRIESAQLRMARIDAELVQLQEAARQAQAQGSEARSVLEQALARMADMDSLRRQLEHERQALHERREQARVAAREARDVAHALALDLQAQQARLSGLAQALERMHGQHAQTQSRYNELAAQMADGDAPVMALERERQALLQQRIDIDRQLSVARSNVDGIDAEMRRFEQIRQQCDHEALRRLEAISRLRLDEQALLIGAQQLAAAITGAGYEVDTVLAELSTDADADTAGKRLADLEHRIRRLEPVNLAAIQEYEELSQRKQYLDTQHADLTTALLTLEGAIRKIDRETRGRFKDTFDRVNTGMQELYPRLFGGGHAYLELTGEDLLDTGVAIMARPPGKRVSNISLLSGGEKALTAVALVFAIFRLNPAPFCLLDEVDAPLDEANVGRFCAMLREMSEKVQFLFVTHNKATMESAQQLSGVTMREPGVSRLVSVDLAEAARLAGAA